MVRGVKVGQAQLSPVSVQTAFNSVRWARLPLTFSLVMVLNFVLMPMKAYITENFPWAEQPSAQAYANFTDFNTSTLKIFQQLYNDTTLPPGVQYYEDARRQTHIMRHAFDMNNYTPVPPDECIHSILLGLPGALFYGPAFKTLLCTFASTNFTGNSSRPWNGRGTCMDQDYLGMRLAYQCIWLTQTNSTRFSFTLTYAITLYPESLWPWIKLLFRLSYTCFVVYLLWTNYYKHCWEMKKTLMHYGHLADTTGGIYSYTIIIGDPTAVILTSPWVSLAFMIDIASSYPINVLALLRASQNDDVRAMLIAFLYLSRTVWFSYLNMAFLNIFLKYFNKEHLIDEMDPTIVAIYSVISGAALTYSIGNFAPLLQALHALQIGMVPSIDQDKRNEAFLFGTVYALVLGSLPLVCSLFMAQLRIYRRSSRAKVPAIMVFLRWFSQYPNCESLGGSVYAVFHANPQYKQCPTVSFRSVDCYVYCHVDGKLLARIRLSLLGTLDRHFCDPKSAISTSAAASPYTFSCIDMIDPSKPPLLRSSKHASAWCM